MREPTLTRLSWIAVAVFVLVVAVVYFLSAARADGWVLVPQEPTEAMICAGIAERHGQPVPEAWSLATVNIYRAMLAALTNTGEKE